MRRAAVVQEVPPAEKTDDEIEVGCRAGEETGRDAARQGARRQVLRGAVARATSAPESAWVRVSNYKMGTDPIFLISDC